MTAPDEDTRCAECARWVYDDDVFAAVGGGEVYHRKCAPGGRPVPTPDPVDAAVRRAAAAFAVAAPELDPRSPAGYGPWRAALEAAGLPAALARVAELEAEVAGARDALRLVERDRGHWRAAVERVRALLPDPAAPAPETEPGDTDSAERAGWYAAMLEVGRALDAAGTPATPEPPQ